MGVNLTQQDVVDLQHKGYSEAQIKEAVGELEKEDQGNPMATKDPRSFAQQSSFGSRGYSDDIVKWQLELNDILERAEHILRGDVVKFKEGHLIWVENPNPEQNCLNEFGVKLIMQVLANYINRNTILSDYEQDEINYKVFDLGRELNNIIFMKYEEMGMDTEDKRKEYPMLVRKMVDIVHSSYKRALKGGERRSLREMIQISQSHQMMAQGGMTVSPTGQPTKTRGLLNPMRYISGKNV